MHSTVGQQCNLTLHSNITAQVAPVTKSSITQIWVEIVRFVAVCEGELCERKLCETVLHTA